MIWIIFGILALAAVLSAIGVITHRNPVYCAVFLIVTFFCLAGCYFLLQAPFLSIVQIIVYAGAIMVLFLFVIMLLHLPDDAQLPLHRPMQVLFGVLFGVALLTQLFIFILTAAPLFTGGTMLAEKMALGNVEAVGALLYSDYIYPFEIASLLLLVAIIGAIVLTGKKPVKEI